MPVRPCPPVPGDTGTVNRWRHRPGPFVLVAALLLVLAACGADAAGDATAFDPGTACVAASDEGHFPGAYPDLEALLPTGYEGATPSVVDSGRTCTPESLGTLRERGVQELHFAGATWDQGNGKGLTIAVFEAPGLVPERMIEFYEAGAMTARRTNDLRTSDATIGGKAGRRLDVLYGDSEQTIVAWPAAQPDRVRVILAADLGDTKVAELLAVLASEPAPS